MGQTHQPPDGIGQRGLAALDGGPDPGELGCGVEKAGVEEPAIARAKAARVGGGDGGGQPAPARISD